MTDPIAAFENNDKVAHAVLSFIRESHESYGHLVLRPFNRFDTAYTEWWIIPSNEWPAYRFSKLCFHRRPRSPDGALYVGYYVEKGLGQSLHGLPGVQIKHMMRDDWYWHKFLSDASSGLIEGTAREVCNNAGTAVRTLLEVHEFNKVPEPDRERSEPSDWIEFAIQFSNFEWVLVRPGQNVLSAVNESEGISSLARQVDALRDFDFYWLDWVIGVRLCYGQEASQGWEAPDIWNKVLRMWLPFGLQ